MDGPVEGAVLRVCRVVEKKEKKDARREARASVRASCAKAGPSPTSIEFWQLLGRDVRKTSSGFSFLPEQLLQRP